MPRCIVVSFFFVILNDVVAAIEAAVEAERDCSLVRSDGIM